MIAFPICVSGKGGTERKACNSDTDFTNGEISYSTVPNAYGVVSVDYTTLFPLISYMDVSTEGYTLLQTESITATISEPT